MNTEPQNIARADIGPAQAIVPMDLMQRAITSGADIVVLEKLMGLQERWEANQARKAFDAAIAEAKADIPIINKTRVVDYRTTKGHTKYSYEDFAEIARTVAPILSRHGLYYRFRTEAHPPLIAVTCIISHRDGHSEETTLSAQHDESGNKNSTQAIGRAVTYLQRYTLKAALGLAASDDDDGQAAGAPKNSDAADAYAERWLISLGDYTSADELNIEWNSESDIRRNIPWPIGTLPKLKGEIIKRIEELKKAEASRNKPDLATARLNAEDA